MLYKFRSMRVAPLDIEVTAGDDPRITPIGRILRRTKVDELPELWNVLRGDMALVGPRPEVPKYVDLADPRWSVVLKVRPGLTDPTTLEHIDEESLLAAVSGDRDEYYRCEILPRKLEGYIAYIEQRSWLTDLRVLVKTAGILFRHRSPRV